jgi:glutathione synthase/RimK-type ligase-like ATP-grasp enzyme
MKSQPIARILSEDIDHCIQKDLARLQSDQFTLSIYFGKNITAKYNDLCRALYALFEAPLLRAQFIYKDKWLVQQIRAISLSEVPESHRPYLKRFARDYFSRKKMPSGRTSRMRYNLALLTDPSETEPPSNSRALKRFIRAASAQGLSVEIIGKEDMAWLGDYDALFIRATTSVPHYTYRFARKASAEGLVVIDDPLSIVRCTNKVYLAELLARYRIPGPKTLVVHRENSGDIERHLGFPCVLKQPDSSFSFGVVKAACADDLHKALDTLFARSDYIVAQEYIFTEFDWRVGILDKKPLFVCKYFMARNHWQIYNWKAGKKSQYGKWETLAVDDAPADVVHCALRAANAVGDGFYGVDVKQKGRKAYVIEVNDNPSVEAGVEDNVLGERLYQELVRVFIERIRLLKEKELA